MKKYKFLIISCFLFILASIALTWAFFSYVYIGNDNIVKTGNITFNADYTSVTLNDVFPIKDSNALTDTENVMTVNVAISGKTSYENGVDFKVMTKDVNNFSGGNEVPINILVSTSNLENIKTINYQEEMTIVDNSLLAQGIINKDETVNGTVTIKAYISESNVLISDTYDGSESDNKGTTNKVASNKKVFKTSEWNSLGESNSISFKIKIIANVHENSLYDVLVNDATLDNVASEYVTSSSGIDFSKISSNTNGRGLYMMSDTKDDPYPIVYYRGNVSDNNVIFGNICWKIVRTTETGGTKLIYNGYPGNVYEKTILQDDDYNIITNTGNFTYDENSGYWGTFSDSSNGLEFSFNIPAYSEYIVDVLGYVNHDNYSEGTYTLLKDGNLITTKTATRWSWITDANELGSVSANTKVTIRLASGGWEYFYVRLIKKGNLLGTGCDNTGSDTLIKSIGLNTLNNSPAYSGYMYNKVYKYVDESPISNAYFSGSIIYAQGKYKLINSEVNYANQRFYTCNSTSSNDTCEKVRFYITANRYIELSDGVNIDDALNEMLNNDNVNQIDSIAKEELEGWYYETLRNYDDSIEDTVWCNERSATELGAFSQKNGGDLFYNTYKRVQENSISLKCSNKTDRFSLTNRLAQLNYSIGLITSDEIRLAGAQLNTTNINFYLYNKAYFWTMSPASYSVAGLGARNYRIVPFGALNDNDVIFGDGLRPVISLSLGTNIEKGDGTIGNPYVIS